MNKWQIICPVTAMLIAVLAFGIVHERREYRGFINAASYAIGHDLIANSNSSHLVAIQPELQVRLSEILRSPTRIATVLLGDEAPPAGDGIACSRLILTNQLGKSVHIRLGQANSPGMFRVLSFQ